MILSGTHYLHAKPGERDELNCPVCGTKCDINRNCNGPTCFAESVGGQGHLHDRFTCPHQDQDWHHYASLLITQKQDCPSRRVRALIDLDLQETLRSRSVI